MGNYSSLWVEDIEMMHEKFGVNNVVSKMSADQLREFLKFRIDCLKEELTELEEAKTADDAVDALIDLIVFAIGTLDAFEVDADSAWDKVYDANMIKEPGIKPERPNPMGFPDMIKPEGWTAPSHAGNVGLFAKILPES